MVANNSIQNLYNCYVKKLKMQFNNNNNNPN